MSQKKKRPTAVESQTFDPLPYYPFLVYELVGFFRYLLLGHQVSYLLHYPPCLHQSHRVHVRSELVTLSLVLMATKESDRYYQREFPVACVVHEEVHGEFEFYPTYQRSATSVSVVSSQSEVLVRCPVHVCHGCTSG